MEHLDNHGQPHSTIVCQEGCPHCAASLLLPAIHDAYFNGTAEQKAAIYALQDGYGEVGYVPEQGYDWSGVRDSSYEAIQAMYALVRSWGYA
jgi:hypothetical protein